MAASIGKVVKRLAKQHLVNSHRNLSSWTCQAYYRKQTRLFCTDERENHGFIRTDNDFDDVDDDVEEPKSFATLLRESKFVQLGDLKDKIVNGRVTEIIGNDLYIDFGGKFPCCCPNPSQQPGAFFRGKTVRVCIHQFEMASVFMGSETAITLLEADCSLMGGRDLELGIKTGSVDMETGPGSEGELLSDSPL